MNRFLVLIIAILISGKLTAQNDTPNEGEFIFRPFQLSVINPLETNGMEIGRTINHNPEKYFSYFIGPNFNVLVQQNKHSVEEGWKEYAPYFIYSSTSGHRKVQMLIGGREKMIRFLPSV